MDRMDMRWARYAPKRPMPISNAHLIPKRMHKKTEQCIRVNTQHSICAVWYAPGMCPCLHGIFCTVSLPFYFDFPFRLSVILQISHKLLLVHSIMDVLSDHTVVPSPCVRHDLHPFRLLVCLCLRRWVATCILLLSISIIRSRVLQHQLEAKTQTRVPPFLHRFFNSIVSVWKGYLPLHPKHRKTKVPQHCHIQCIDESGH